MPGMRVLGDLKCPNCGKEFYGDLPVGQALYSPVLLEKDTGLVSAPLQPGFKRFSTWLEMGFKNRSATEIRFVSHQNRPARGGSSLIILNCLDALYGHCLLKLLNAQYYLDHYPDSDLVVIVPSFLRWMVPKGVTATWEVDWPLKTGYQWNDWLAAKIKSLASGYQEVFASVAYSHPHPEDYDISRFVGLSPFAVSEWESALSKPKVAFIWREDRLWAHQRGRFFRLWSNRLHQQVQNVGTLAKCLKAEIPNLEFVVVGLGANGKLPIWVRDERANEITEMQDRRWCRLYSECHLVIGVHGSNMLLPSGLAGAVIDLMPDDRWGNVLQDILFQPDGLRERLYRSRFVPLQTTPATLAKIAKHILLSYPNMQLTMSREATRHHRE